MAEDGLRGRPRSRIDLAQRIEVVPITAGLEQVVAGHSHQANAPQVVLGETEKEFLSPIWSWPLAEVFVSM